ncbi:hypothetical protein [Niveispirillum fermenti]|uniref:hypothetical protein n=1 Tax=Niveispirillum fermenti TaxID=1233113 RepID=UPI003A8A591E
MLGSFLRRLTGARPEVTQPAAPAPVAPPPVEEPPRQDSVVEETALPPPEADFPLASLEALPGPAVNGPVFSSRAVRDATVVTAIIELLNRFVGGQDLLDDLTWRLESLTHEQVNFLQLSAGPGLIHQAQTRVETMKGTKAAALRKLLTDLAGGAIPEPLNRASALVIPKGPIVPPLSSLQPRAGNLVPPPAPSPSPSPAVSPPQPAAAVPPRKPAPSPAAEPASVAEPVGGPPIAPISVSLPPLSAESPRPAAAPAAGDGPDAADGDGAKPVSAPLPPPRAAAPAAAAPGGAVPRLGRQDAEARRARLLASLNDTLSSSEAAP